MMVLIPFQLLKLQQLIEKSPSKEHFTRLQELIENDIIGSIKANLQVGNITEDDANPLMELTRQLCQHIYRHYEELEGGTDMKPLLDGAMELPLDKYRIRIDQLEAEIASLKEETAKIKTETAKIKTETSKIKTETSKIKTETSKIKAETARLKEEKNRLEEEKNMLENKTQKLMEEISSSDNK